MVFSVLLTTAMGLLAPWLIRELVRVVRLGEESRGAAASGIAWLGGGMAMAYLLRSLGRFCNDHHSHVIAWRVCHDLRAAVYRHLQRLSIARAVLKDAPILILDEATSSVDTRTEADIHQALLRLRRGRTCLLIAHRLSTARDADLIAVIDAGRLVACGPHEEIVARAGLYRELHAQQGSA
ncbi:MAG: hypothetical protein ACOCXJ_05065 [Planctomycetota bacterium]